MRTGDNNFLTAIPETPCALWLLKEVLGGEGDRDARVSFIFREPSPFYSFNKTKVRLAATVVAGV